MNRILAFMMIFSLLYSCFSGTLNETASACFDGANDAILLVMSFAGVMCIWTGILRLAEKSGVSRLIGRVLKPVIRCLFPKLREDSSAAEYITLNITANLLGLANGATPMGVKAMQALKDEGREDYMNIFAVLNTAAFQLIPTSVLAIRSGAGAKIDIVHFIWLSSACSLACALAAVKIFCCRERK